MIGAPAKNKDACVVSLPARPSIQSQWIHPFIKSPVLQVEDLRLPRFLEGRNLCVCVCRCWRRPDVGNLCLPVLFPLHLASIQRLQTLYTFVSRREREHKEKADCCRGSLISSFVLLSWERRRRRQNRRPPPSRLPRSPPPMLRWMTIEIKSNNEKYGNVQPYRYWQWARFLFHRRIFDDVTEDIACDGYWNISTLENGRFGVWMARLIYLMIRVPSVSTRNY